MSRTAPERKQPEPWWAAEGTETCSCCGQTYAHQMERRCDDCDAPLCPICACRHCASEQQQEDEK